jgi:hypothetical protein
MNSPKVVFVPRPYFDNSPERIRGQAKSLKKQLEAIDDMQDLNNESVRGALTAARVLCRDLLRPRPINSAKKSATKRVTDAQVREALVKASGSGRHESAIIGDAEERLGITDTAIRKRIPSLGFWRKV